MLSTGTVPSDTVTLMEFDFPSARAVILELPAPTAVNIPFSFTVTTLLLEDDQVTVWLVASSGKIVTLRGLVSPTIISMDGSSNTR